MTLTNIEKKCTIDYLKDLIPTQKRLMKKILNGKTLSVDSQISVIGHTLKVAGEVSVYDYNVILKVLNGFSKDGKGSKRLDEVLAELESGFDIKVI